ncbi:MAG: hypothetical protein ACT4O3_02740 [Elusimicrobiota bacterium]
MAAVHGSTGISTNFTGLSFANLEIGKSHDLGVLAGRPFEVRNHGSKPLRLRVEPEPASPAFLLEGYKPLPSARWITVHPQEFIVPPGSAARARVTLKVPADRRLAGEKYQGALWIRSIGEETVQMGLRVKVPFTLSAGARKAPRSSPARLDKRGQIP